MRILIVEDNWEEMQKAVEVVQQAGHEAITAMTVSNALELIGEEGWDEETEKRTFTKKSGAPEAVLSDIMVGWGTERGKAEVPAGVLVCWVCKTLGIPVQFCTDGYHHGPSLNWVCVFARMNNMKIVDGEGVQGKCDRDEHGTKNWARALRWLIAGKPVE